MLSICIPTYNRSKFVIESFERVIDNDLITEIIIVDDNSDNSIFEKLQKLILQLKNPKIKLFRNIENKKAFYKISFSSRNRSAISSLKSDSVLIKLFLVLFKSCGFEILEVGQWGNYEYITKLFLNHQWPGFRDLSLNGIKNEERNVVNCWILAKK